MTTHTGKATRRQCGDCQLCCFVVPVSEIAKKANTKCAMQSFAKGCKVYNTTRMPMGCALWNCRWLVNDDMDDQRRPDRSHLVVDMMPDYVVMRDEESKRHQNNIPVVQVWVDPKHPDAWRLDDFKQYMLRRGAEGNCFLIRNGNEDAIFVAPPTFFQDPNADWIVQTSNLSSEKQHTAEQIAAAIGDIRVEIAE